MSRVPVFQYPDTSTIPRLGQGTWYLGEKSSARKEELAALRTGIECGMTLIDTAEMYGEGLSEKLVGEAISHYDREALYLVSKVYPWNAGEDQIFHSCENSLRRLGTEYLDMYLLHWRGSVPLEETAECMEELVRQGKIRNWGVSNLDLEDMEELWESETGKNCRVNQCLYHIASRGVETVLLPWMQQQNMPLMAYCPLAQGGTLRSRMLNHPLLKELAAQKQCSVWQLMLAFLLANPDVIAIPRTGKAKHAEENAAAADVVLTSEELALLNEAFPAPRRREMLDIM